jgi:hypothetical protein
MILKVRIFEKIKENHVVHKIQYVRTFNIKFGIAVYAVLVFLRNVLVFLSYVLLYFSYVLLLARLGVMKLTKKLLVNKNKK